MKMIEPKEFESEVLRSTVPVLIDFYTDQCSPCRNMIPVLEEIEQESNGSFKIVKIDATRDPQFSASFRIAAVPTFVLFQQGQRVAQCTGAKTKKDYFYSPYEAKGSIFEWRPGESAVEIGTYPGPLRGHGRGTFLSTGTSGYTILNAERA